MLDKLRLLSEKKIQQFRDWLELDTEVESDVDVMEALGFIAEGEGDDSSDSGHTPTV